MRRVIAALISLSGMFYYKSIGEKRFFLPQFAFFVFAGMAFGSCLLYRKSKWMGILAAFCAFGFLKTFLMQHVGHSYLFRQTLIGFGIFLIYFAARQLNLKESILKFFLIPAIANIALVFVQAFDHQFYSFMPVAGVTGFLGSKGVTALFLGMTTPIFLKHLKKGIPFLLGAIILCKGVTGLLVFLAVMFFWLWHKAHKRLFVLLMILLILIVRLGVLHSADGTVKGELGVRAAMWVGTIDGIKHNPILGWGVGNFDPIMKQLKPEETKYAGSSFNYPDGTYMNHPHNELLLGTWYFGLGFPIIICAYIWALLRKFTKKKILPFSIILAGFVGMNAYFMPMPAWLLLMVGLAIYENN